jgi:hypothetical protein
MAINPLDTPITLRLRRGPKAARSRSVGTGYCLTLMLSALMLISYQSIKSRYESKALCL